MDHLGGHLGVFVLLSSFAIALISKCRVAVQIVRVEDRTNVAQAVSGDRRDFSLRCIRRAQSA